MKLGVYSHVIGKVVAEPKKIKGLLKVRLHIGKDRKVGSVYEHRFMDLLFYDRNPLKEKASKELQKGMFISVRGQSVESLFDRKIFNELLPDFYEIITEDEQTSVQQDIVDTNNDDLDFEM